MERKCEGRTGRKLATAAAGREINRRLDAGQVLFRKLKPGPGHSRAEVVENQRARLGAALIELAVEYGYETITVRGLSRSAGVSTGTFYSHFANVEDCFVDTYESVMRQALDAASPEPDPRAGWEAGVRGRMLSLMEAIAANPKAAQLVLVEAYAVRSEIQDRLGDALAPFERLMTTSFNSAPTRAVAPPHLVSGIAAGVMCVARMTLLTGKPDALPGLADEVADWMLSLPSEQLLGARTAQPCLPAGTSARAELQIVAGPSGPNREADERARIFNAVAKLAATGGFTSLTGPRIRSEAGVTRRRFEASFVDVTECFLGAVNAVTAPAATRAERQGEAAPTWSRGVHRAVSALCTEVARDKRLAQLTVDLLAPGRRGLLHREHLISLGAARLYARAPYGERPSALAAEASIASVWNIATAEISTGRAKALTRLAPLFTFLILAPAIGATTAVTAIRAEGLPL